MCNQIQTLNDDSVAQVAIDHPCIHDFVDSSYAQFNGIHICRVCDFFMTQSEYKKYKEKTNG